MRIYGQLPGHEVPQDWATLHFADAVCSVVALGSNAVQCVVYCGSHCFVRELYDQRSGHCDFTIFKTFCGLITYLYSARKIIVKIVVAIIATAKSE